jgi:D-alanyl-lipoteichoic acid acyltransferase DltB (MBOAT superfamily)
MLFNSFEFLIFLPCVFAAYWALARQLRLQNLLVLATSYIFYGWWDWRFLSLIAFTSAWSYCVGLVELCRWDKRPSKSLLAVSLVVNLGILGYFKYCGFFVDSLVALMQQLHLVSPAGVQPFARLSLDIVLPVGISFYTFQALSYTIDVYRREVRPTKDPVGFFAFISFFPQLVAGPIERASNLLPQFLRQKEFSYERAVDGCRQMLWGFFKKCVVADNCAVVADFLLNGSAGSNGLGVWLGVLLFTVQIYGDFSGYSDIAIGVSRLFGVNLMRNFAYPYFARDIAEFWRRWHMSLTTWFRDYLYIPLGGSRCGRWRQARNTFAIFLASGMWHGANWTFVLWGAFHALLFLPLLLAGRNRRRMGVTAENRMFAGMREAAGMAGTFLLVMMGWTLFRARSAGEALRWYGEMFNPCTFALLHDLPRELPVALLGAAMMFAVEWVSRRGEHALARLPRRRVVRWAAYYALLWLVVFYAPGSQTFIYFQF